MNVLIGFEQSGIIREAFKKRGHNAWSCDLLPSLIPGQHLRCDIFDAFDHFPKKWDLIILHPPCTCLSVSGNHVYAKGKKKYQERIDAVAYTIELWIIAKYYGKRVCLENPVGVLTTMTNMGVKPQYIQPFQFGHSESKKTGLWLYNLPELKPTGILEKPACGYWENQTPSGQNKLGSSKGRWKIRSKTYQGIADCMAATWG